MSDMKQYPEGHVFKRWTEQVLDYRTGKMTTAHCEQVWRFGKVVTIKEIFGDKTLDECLKHIL
ncbi:hypothetical protein [Alicyclobacillus acidoterrestris]|uniref:Uncharacterized protein n=1 Tax=Alicyclobacillus acidoterrestris (strain ATCC 49025 / DSM 3922 / CIP 106132 / NCIMB 13137 / GD3B) TaxID=1356854 RepID=T0BUI2_ALIAG|nr:hypothetical protein [Alicyclobacillus acidoterrestris]EPZ47753.1 hypothetical protein N007_05725 [Alicyclobacillus acidoterrestris ATCC 49025]UNO47942.1 hypothetical protein K1I37_14805 [Alicyclobacillus acidoterrestris]